MKKDYYISAAIALSLHIVFFLLIFINLHILLLKTYGKPAIKNIQTYLFYPEANKSYTNKEQLKFIYPNTHAKAQLKIDKMPAAVNKHPEKTYDEKKSLQSGKNSAKLLEILHDQIRANQRYPQNALLLEQRGTVRLAFRLFPDGHLDNLRVVESSAVESLDQSAIVAVNSITPVAIANIYLKEPKEFFINVVYR